MSIVLLIILLLFAIASHCGLGILILGQSRSGKSTSMIEYVVRDAGRVAKCIVDPQASLAAMALQHLYLAGKERLVRLIDLSNITRGFGFLRLSPSRATNPLQRRQENDNEIMNFGRILLNRSKLSASSNRLIWEWLYWGIRLVLYAGKLPYYLPYAYQPTTPTYAELLRDCTDEETRTRMEQVAAFSRSQLRSEVAPALRVSEVCYDPAFIACCGRNVDLDEQFRQRRIIICSGEGANYETIRMLQIALISKTIQHSERHNTPVQLMVDEWNNFDLLTVEFGNAIATLQKKNLDFILASQTLTANKTVLNKILENTQVKRYHRIGDPRTVKFAASDIGMASMDEKGSTRNERLSRRDLTRLAPGEFIEVNHGRVSHKHPPKPEDPYPWPGLLDAKLKKIVVEILSSADYHDVSSSLLPNSLSDDRLSGADETNRSSNSADDTRPPSTNSTRSSQRARRERRQRRSSRGAQDGS